MERLEENGYEAYLVGGCVRDALRGVSPGDYDMAVSSSPEETKTCFADHRTVDTGIKHGTVTVVSDGHNLELTTFRCDGSYTDSRHPDAVEFTRDIHADIARRDLTVNAMAYSPRHGLVDDFSGREDLKNGLLRAVGDPRVRFGEDALRIMRTLRFASVLGFAVEENTAAALFEKRELLKLVAPERIFSELKKLLSGASRAKVLTAHREILHTVLPELAKADEETYAGLVRACAECSSPETRFASLLSHVSPETAENVCRRLRTDNRFRKTVVFLLENKDRSFRTPGEVKRFAGSAGMEKLPALLEFRRAAGREDNGIFEATVPELTRENGCLTAAQLAVGGEDLLRLGKSGREIGEALDALLCAVTDGRAENTKEALLRILTGGNDDSR